MVWGRRARVLTDRTLINDTKSTLELPQFSLLGLPTQPPDRRFWYCWWLNKQVENEPKETFSCLLDYGADAEYRMGDCYIKLWQEVWRHMILEAAISIDDLIVRLSNDQVLNLSSDPKSFTSARKLVFATIGWQTMLYRSDSGSCPSAQLAIIDEMDGHKGQGHMCLKQNETCCKKQMHNFLLGFGILLPPRNFNTLESTEDQKAFKDLKEADISTFNAHFLTLIGRLRIVWTDSLACHMELDRASNSIFLFRFPSFCATHVQLDKAEALHKSVLHACSAPYSSQQWGTADDVEQMLKETLLSYRLLFGQGKVGRQLFRKLSPFGQIPETGRDSLLTQLCSRKHCPTDIELPEKETYNLPRDFPIYRSRLAILLHHLNCRKPRSWKEVWQDKRDSASWLTFWAILIFGGVGLLLALLQVVLQIVQIKVQKG